jgi:hypothetical protein
MSQVVEDHLESSQVSALEHDPSNAAVMAGTLVVTGVAVGLAELYSEVVGTEVRTGRRVERSRMLAKWSGLALTGFYGFCAARLSGIGLLGAALQAAAVAAIGGFLIGLKAVIH